MQYAYVRLKFVDGVKKLRFERSPYFDHERRKEYDFTDKVSEEWLLLFLRAKLLEKEVWSDSVHYSESGIELAMDVKEKRPDAEKKFRALIEKASRSLIRKLTVDFDH